MSIQAQILRQAADPRGWLFEPLDAAALAGCRNVHVVLTRPGHIRGNHFHRRTTEILAVAGPALVRVRGGGAIRDFVVPVREAHRFTMAPGTPHAILNTGTEMGLTVSFTDQVHDPQDPDTVREVLIEPQAG
ncbi:MAG: polysaccharide biosynthesis C-terminal domain-containing protein [Limisphaerales bacterium]